MGDRATRDQILLMSRERVERSLQRMAYQIVEETRDAPDILVIGLKNRGYVIAQMLGEILSGLTEKDVAIHQFVLDTDNASLFDSPEASYEYAVLVDDVIFSGQTMFDAMLAILDRIRPATVRTAVLVDRGHRSLPVEAGYVGLELPTKLDEHVEVQTDDSGIKKVVLNNSTN